MAKSHRLTVVEEGRVQAGPKSVGVAISALERANQSVPYIHVKRHRTSRRSNTYLQKAIDLIRTKQSFLPVPLSILQIELAVVLLPSLLSDGIDMAGVKLQHRLSRDGMGNLFTQLPIVKFFHISHR
jgi:hypothetical protein